MKIEGIIFDFDGTLVDSQYIWENIDDKYLESLGKSSRPGLHKTIEKFTLRQAAEYLKSEYQINDSVEGIINSVKALAADEYLYNVPLKDGVLDALEEMSRLGVKMCVATTNVKQLVVAAAKRCGIDKYFSDYFSGSDLNINKNTPKLYELALEHLGTDKDKTWIFEDSLHAVISAKVGGFNVAAVYDESSKELSYELRQNADLYIQAMKEWKKIYD